MKKILLFIFLLLSFNICNSQKISESDAKKKKQDVKDEIKSLRIQKRTAVLQAQLDSQTNEYPLQPNESVNYSANVLTSNFSIPLARFNFTGSPDITNTVGASKDTKNGEILLFNSIGAGVSFNHGVYTATTNGNSEIVNHEFVNIIGVQAGFLFSAGTGEDAKNVFAPVVNIVALDFQLGFGWELGTIKENQKRGFLTLSYAIPMYKLSRTGFYILNKRFKDKVKPIETPQKSMTEQAIQEADAKVRASANAEIKAREEESQAKSLVSEIFTEVNKLKTELQTYKAKYSAEIAIASADSQANKEIMANLEKLVTDLDNANKRLEQANSTLYEARTNAKNKAALYQEALNDANAKAKAKEDAEVKAKLLTDPNAEKPNTMTPSKTNPNSSGFLKL